MKKVLVLVFVGALLVTNVKWSESKAVAEETGINVEVADSQKELPDLESVLYNTWEESTCEDFEYETWVEDVSPSLLACADTYVIDSYEYDENSNLVAYWHTDYMKARLIAFANTEYKTMQANYYVEEDGDYTGDTLYFRR